MFTFVFIFYVCAFVLHHMPYIVDGHIVSDCGRWSFPRLAVAMYREIRL